MIQINPIAYGFLRFRQLRGGGGAFWPGPRKQGYGYRIDLKFAINNVTDDTGKHAEFTIIGCSTFRDMTSQKFPFQKGMSHRDSILTPWNQAKFEKKSLFMPENIFSATKLYLPLRFYGFQAKQKNSYVLFFETSHFKNNCSNPPGESVLLKFCQNVSNR